MFILYIIHLCALSSPLCYYNWELWCSYSSVLLCCFSLLSLHACCSSGIDSKSCVWFLFFFVEKNGKCHRCKPVLQLQFISHPNQKWPVSAHYYIQINFIHKQRLKSFFIWLIVKIIRLGCKTWFLFVMSFSILFYVSVTKHYLSEIIMYWLTHNYSVITFLQLLSSPEPVFKCE